MKNVFYFIFKKSVIHINGTTLFQSKTVEQPRDRLRRTLDKETRQYLGKVEFKQGRKRIKIIGRVNIFFLLLMV
jgi:hypothetical protein